MWDLSHSGCYIEDSYGGLASKGDTARLRYEHRSLRNAWQALSYYLQQKSPPV